MTTPLLCTYFTNEFVTAWSTFGLFIVTTGLALFGLLQLKAISNTNRETFLHELKKDFFTENARLLLSLLQHDLLVFHVHKFDKQDIEIGKFTVKEGSIKMLEALEINPNQRLSFTTYEIDDYLLMHMEDLGFLYKKCHLSMTDVIQSFGYYIETLWENAEIKKYIDWTRTENDDIYSNFEKVYNKIQSVDTAHRPASK